jgi:two-component system NtrC family sensor kinase
VSEPGSARVQNVCGIVTALIGVSTLGGWITGQRAFSSVRPDFIPMAPNTAIGFVLLGISLVVMPRAMKNSWRTTVAVALAGFAACLTGLSLLEYVMAIELGVQGWFLRVPAERLGQAPLGRMALSTALSFVAASTAVVLPALSRRRFALECAGILGLALVAMGSVFSLGYLYRAPFFYGGTAIPMALNTAAAFTILGLGLISAAGPSALPMRPFVGTSVRSQLLRAFVPFTLMMVVVSGWVTQAVAWFAPPSSMAIASAASVVIAILVAALLCAVFASGIGRRLDQAESELKSANDLLESRVHDRTRDLQHAKALLEERNEQLRQSADELSATADSVRTAHQELQSAHEELKRAETQLVQSERLSSLGQVVAGVAHEINNPLAFVTNNVTLLERDVTNLNELIQLYQEAEGTLEQYQHGLMSRIRALAEQIDLAYVLDNLPALMNRSREGLRRIQKIVRDLRDFVRLDEAELKEADLNESIRSTVTLVQGLALARGVALVEDIKPLSPLSCYPAKINQVLMSLVSNAIEACDAGDAVTVGSEPAAEHGVVLTVADTGRGIDPSIRARIFDPFFTTKPVGQGTGLGLAISYGIVKAHGGVIQVESEPGRGSRFTIHLPAQPPPQTVTARVIDRETSHRPAPPVTA